MKIDKKKLRKALYIYITIILALIFSSRTIYNMSLPKASVAMPQSGSLSKEFEARGFISFSETFDIYANSSGQIDEMLIKKGDMINKDTVIAIYKEDESTKTAEVLFNIALIENQLEGLTLSRSDIQDKLRKSSVTSSDDLWSSQWAVADAKKNVESCQAKLLEAQRVAAIPFDEYNSVDAKTDIEWDWNRKVAELRDAEAALLSLETDNLEVFDDYTDESWEKALSDARKRVEAALEALDEIARIAKENLNQAENNLADARIALERAETNLSIAEKTLAGQAEDNKKSLEMELRRIDLDIARANIDLRSAEASLNSNIPDLRSDYQGVVISVEKQRGQFVAQGEKIATVGVRNRLFTSEIIISETDGRFVEIGDEVNLYKSGLSTAIKAVVYDILPEGGENIKINIICETDEFNGGEYVTVKFQKQTEVYNTLVPNEAIFNENMGNYVWVVRSRQGALGIEYYSVKVRIFVTDSDDFYSAVSRGLEMIEPVVVSHDKDLTVNGRLNRLE